MTLFLSLHNMTGCTVKTCKNRSDRKDDNVKVTFHTFPTDPVAADTWTSIMKQCGRESTWTPKKSTVICSDHFDNRDIQFTKFGGRRIRRGAVPRKNLYISKYIHAESSPIESENEDSKYNVDAIEIEESGLYISRYNNLDRSLMCENAGNEDNEEDIDVKNVIMCLETRMEVSDTPIYIEDDSDLDIDTQNPSILHNQLKKRMKLQLKHQQIIKSLRKKVHRLERAKTKLEGTIKLLKSKPCKHCNKHEKYLNEENDIQSDRNEASEIGYSRTQVAGVLSPTTSQEEYDQSDPDISGVNLGYQCAVIK